MANRTTVKSNIQSLNVPSVTNEDLEDMLNDSICDNVVFKEHLTRPTIEPPTTSFSVDFNGFDSVQYSKTGANINITNIINLKDGQTGFLALTKSAGSTVNFSGATDVTLGTRQVTQASNIVYRITRKGSNYYAEGFTKPTYATDTEVIGSTSEIPVDVEALDFRLASLKAKVIQIGAWNMDAVERVNINLSTYGITKSQIRMLDVWILADTNASSIIKNMSPYPLLAPNNSSFEIEGTWGVSDFAGAPDILQLMRKANGLFDSTDFNGSSNRGYITILYV